MTLNTYDLWVKQVQKSLKVEALPVFEKKITGTAAISPFSVGQSAQFLQKNYLQNTPFLAIQNFSELVNGGLKEWLAHPDVGLRFRQLDDIPCDETIKNKSLFLSQPFLFLPSTEQLSTIAYLQNAQAHLNLGWSPLSFGLTRGEILKKPLKGLHSVAENAEMLTPNTTWFYLSSAPYQWAGAEPHAELGILLSVTYELLREMNACKMSLADSVKKISFGLALGTDVVVEPAKIISMRLLLQKLISLLDNDLVMPSPQIFAMPSLRVYSARQPWNNLIRSVLMCSSAIIGGAQGFKCIPYDVLNKNKNSNAIRESTNVPLLLRHEAHLQDVYNPLDGASLFASAVDVICAQAWEFFKEIEKKGGIFETVRTGWLQMELLRQSEHAQTRVKELKYNLVGVNEFVDHRFQYTPSAKSESALIKLESIIDPLFLDKTNDEYMSVQPLVIGSLTQSWEVLQETVRAMNAPSVLVLKVLSPGTEKKFKALVKTLNIIGIKYTVVEEERLLEFIKPQSVVVLMAGDIQKEAQWVADINAIGGVRMLSMTLSSEAVAFVKEESTPFDIAEKIIAQLSEVQ